MSKSHAYVVSFDENVSYLSTSMNVYVRKEQFWKLETGKHYTYGPFLGCTDTKLEIIWKPLSE